MAYGNKPYGLKAVRLIYGGTYVDLEASQKLKFAEKVVTATLRGNDKVLAVLAQSESVDWELDAGGIPLDAYAIMTGRTVVETGVTPNRISTLTGAGAKNFPYFKMVGKSISGNTTDDIHCILYLCKVTALDGTFQGGAFFVSACKGTAVADTSNSDRVYDFIAHETEAALPTS